MAVRSTQETESTPTQRTVEVCCTGHVRTAVGDHEFDFAFEGGTLREFLDAFFDEYDVRGLVIADSEADATTSGWAPTPDRLPGENWAKNPEGEQTKPYARVLVNGRFNEHMDGFDTELENGDRVALMNPFIFCC